MININNSLEMSNYLAYDSDDMVRFPSDANILLNDGSFCKNELNRMDDIGQLAGRSVHLCRFGAACG